VVGINDIQYTINALVFIHIMGKTCTKSDNDIFGQGNEHCQMVTISNVVFYVWTLCTQVGSYQWFRTQVGSYQWFRTNLFPPGSAT